MRGLWPQSFSFSVFLHLLVAAGVALWTWMKPAAKPPPAIFEMVAAPPAPAEEIGETSEQATAPSIEFERNWTPIKLPKPAPEPAADPLPPPDALVRHDPRKPKKDRERTTDSPRKTLEDFRKENPTSNTRRSNEPERRVQAPKISTSGLQASMGNSSSRSRVASLSSAEQRELNEYYALLRALLENAWIRPSGVSTDLRATVNFTVTSDGALTGARIVTGSGSDLLDDSVLDVFKRVTRHRPPPVRQAWNFEIVFGLETSQ